MAKAEHLSILSLGIDGWNTWREENREIFPDLSDANLRRVNLREANLVDVYLRNADLRGADLNLADISGADLIGANLSVANLTKTTLLKTDFSRADLSVANLNEANLGSARLIGTKLIGADLSKANFFKADLWGADLANTMLSGANLQGANCQGANFRKADLYEADLREVNFSRADLRESNLNGAILTGAILHKSQRSLWSIEGVTCRYVYLDPDKKRKEPQDRDFEHGEFEKLFGTKPTFEYIFENGMQWIDAAILEWITSELRSEPGDLNIRLVRVDRYQDHDKATFEVDSEKDKNRAYDKVKSRYDEVIELFKQQIVSYEQQTHMLINLFYQHYTHPRQIVLHGSSKYVEMSQDAKYVEINLNQAIQAIEGIKKAVEVEPEETFKSKSKKKILEHLDNALKDITKDGIKESGKKLLELAQNELLPLLPKIIEQLATLKIAGVW